MATILYKIGGFCAKYKKSVLSIWGTLLILVLAIGVLLKPEFSSEMSIPNTPSEKANDIIAKEFPAGDNKGKMKIIIKSKNNNEIPPKVIEQAIKKIKKDKNVELITNPFESGNINNSKTIGYLDITYKKDKDNLNDKSLEHIKEISRYLNNHNLISSYTGDLMPFELEVGGLSEVIGIGMAFIILFITFGVLLVAGMPILISLIGLLVSISLTLIGTKAFDISSFSLSLSVMIGLAVGIDYALFIFFKHKQQYHEGKSLEESIKLANGTAGSAVVFAGLTVIVALVSLCIIGIPFLGTMGIVAAISVIFAVLSSITVSPALLSLIGNRIINDKKSKILTQKSKSSFLSNIVLGNPIIVSLISIVLLLIISIPAKDMFLGLPDDGMKSKNSQNRISYDLMSEGFGKGINGPLTILVSSDQEKIEQQKKVENYDEISKKIKSIKNVKSVTNVIPNENANYALMTVIPKTGPNDQETSKLVHDIRSLSKNNNKFDVNVTGITAMNIDIGDKLSHAIPLFVSIIVSFAFIVLLTVFRSLFIPIIAVLGFILTLTATLGLSVFILQQGHFSSLLGIPEKGPILAFLPILVIGILFGLAMDYQVFLMSKMHEEYTKTKNHNLSLELGLKYNGPIVIAAGLIMLFVFGGFIFAGDIMIKSMGIALTFGVFFDAFIVRLIIIPSLMKLIGDKSWYIPKWLDRIIPNIDIEGSKLK